MGLETATFISGLTTSWPLSGDNKSQGDDHIRLIKSALQATFPAANRAFYFPKTEDVSGTITLDATDQHNMLQVDTSGGNVVVNLPSTLVPGDKGWACEVMKITNDANAAIVTPASGTIASKVGATATIRVGILCEPARFVWNGTGWICSKPGPMIGTTESFDGVTTPPGYLDSDGSSFSSTGFAELFAVLASSVLKDKRGRVEAGVDGGVGRLTSSYFGTAAILGAVGGAESHTLTTAQLATHSHANSLSDPGHSHSLSGMVHGAIGFAYYQGGIQGGQAQSGTATAATTGITLSNANAGSGSAHNNAQPTIIVKKITRAC